MCSTMASACDGPAVDGRLSRGVSCRSSGKGSREGVGREGVHREGVNREGVKRERVCERREGVGSRVWTGLPVEREGVEGVGVELAARLVHLGRQVGGLLGGQRLVDGACHTRKVRA